VNNPGSVLILTGITLVNLEPKAPTFDFLESCSCERLEDPVTSVLVYRKIFGASVCPIVVQYRISAANMVTE
jgi:hypothetical protein